MEKNLFFYVDDKRILGRDHERVHGALEVMINMLFRMGLESNLKKTKTLVCTPRVIWVKCGETAYKQQAAGEEETLREQKKTRVSCTECGVTVAVLYLKTHMVKIHIICVPHMSKVNEVGGVPTTYVVSLSRVLQEFKYLVPGCPSVAHIARNTLR